MPETVIFRTLQEQIAHHLRHDLLTGRFEPGAPLRETEIAERFGISRGPIRDALRELAQSGLVVFESNRGIRVAERIDFRVRPFLLELRADIETHILAAAYDRLDQRVFDRFEAILADMLEVDDGEPYQLMEHDYRFHLTIVELIDDRDFFNIWNNLISRMLMDYPTTSVSIVAADVHAFHSRVYQAIRSGDVQQACAALTHHIRIREM